VRVQKIGDFEPISRRISETLQGKVFLILYILSIDIKINDLERL